MMSPTSGGAGINPSPDGRFEETPVRAAAAGSGCALRLLSKAAKLRPTKTLLFLQRTLESKGHHLLYNYHVVFQEQSFAGCS